MSLDMLLQILRALEGLTAEVAFVWLQWDVNSDMRSDVIALDSGRTASAPLASKIEIVCALATDMTFADVVLNRNQYSARAKPRKPWRERLHVHKVLLV